MKTHTQNNLVKEGIIARTRLISLHENTQKSREEFSKSLALGLLFHILGIHTKIDEKWMQIILKEVGGIREQAHIKLLRTLTSEDPDLRKDSKASLAANTSTHTHTRMENSGPLSRWLWQQGSWRKRIHAFFWPHGEKRVRCGARRPTTKIHPSASEGRGDWIQLSRPWDDRCPRHLSAAEPHQLDRASPLALQLPPWREASGLGSACRTYGGSADRFDFTPDRELPPPCLPATVTNPTLTPAGVLKSVLKSLMYEQDVLWCFRGHSERFTSKSKHRFEQWMCSLLLLAWLNRVFILK